MTDISKDQVAYLNELAEKRRKEWEAHSMIGKYKADYSPLTTQEIASEAAELSELFNNSTPITRPD